ncbi:MAG TPA: right-handed parallel beta-helix repeat-containing protein [Phycisphaerae bacterium]|nr:right-handed parallel beta-helix repeat-containing protein [Phycisphaerae bacterium]
MKGINRCILAWATVLGTGAFGGQPDEVVPRHDNVEITRDAVIKAGTYRLSDDDGNGVIRIVGDGITVDFRGAELFGAGATQSPDTYSGTGIVISGRGITLRNARVRGFKVGIHARGASGLRLEDCDVSGNYQQRLKSRPQGEDLGDWLSPHANDGGEWLRDYGAGVCLEQCDGVMVQRVRARNGQNGIVLDRVNDSRICDCDCSFLSGWGLAMWRSNRNVISRNAFDFCIRGYSHGVYNRGQDSAGILMFEQNNDNVVAENSATHCGDGLFGFGGTESLAGSGRTGNNNNLIVGNDFSYAAAHGIEMTFSFGNQMIRNRLVGNAICGIWGGYSQDTLMVGNHLEGNGEAGYGAERGGVNIEHGRGNVIKHNTFQDNRCGVFLWSDEDRHLMEKPWIKANHKGSTGNTIGHNTFQGDAVGVQLRKTSNTKLISNAMRGVELEIDADEVSGPTLLQEPPEPWRPPPYSICGESRPVGARDELRGRQNMLITEWGPYDFRETVVVPGHLVGGHEGVFQVLGPSGRFKVTNVVGSVKVSPTEGDLPGVVKVELPRAGFESFRLEVEADGRALEATGTLLRADWEVKFFAWNPSQDPRTDEERWQLLLRGPALESQAVGSIDFNWALGGPSRAVPPDQFGTLAVTTIPLPTGTYKVHTVSDDGIRVWIDGDLVIDDWTWHPPKENDAIVSLPAGRHQIRIEHFEIDGYAQLRFGMEPVTKP